jgi:hypothetical protein
VAAYCCAHLLGKAGFQIDFELVDRTRLPMILLGDRALALIRDIFDQPSMFSDASRIRHRVVAWGAHAAPVSVEHSAIVVSEETILDAIRPHGATQGTRRFDWTILAAGRLSAQDPEILLAYAVPVTLHSTADRETCWIESLDDGWLFLTPGWLLAAGAPAESLLGTSRVAGREIAGLGTANGSFPVSARVAPALARHGWLACGSAAVVFDPICGDGTAHAVRQAILAAAVIRAVAQGGDEAALLAHYHARLIAGFERHLMLCRQFYATGGTGAMWRAEVEAIDRRIAWCRQALNQYGPFRYRLRGFELEAVC